MVPVTGALASGNRVLLKPSEHTPRTSELMARLVAKHFAEDEFAVITGDAVVGRPSPRRASTTCSSPAPRRSAAWSRGLPRRISCR